MWINSFVITLSYSQSDRSQKAPKSSVLPRVVLLLNVVAHTKFRACCYDYYCCLIWLNIEHAVLLSDKHLRCSRLFNWSTSSGSSGVVVQVIVAHAGPIDSLNINPGKTIIITTTRPFFAQQKEGLLKSGLPIQWQVLNFNIRRIIQLEIDSFIFSLVSKEIISPA